MFRFDTHSYSRVKCGVSKPNAPMIFGGLKAVEKSNKGGLNAPQIQYVAI